jgi:hypothetical protein
MRRRRSKFRTGLAVIEAEAPERRRQAERWIRAYYRMHRSLPRGAVACIVPRQRLYTLIFRGELEHILGLVPLLLRFASMRRCAATLRARLRG